MPSIAKTAHQHLRRVYSNKSSAGCVLASSSRNLQRDRFAAEAIAMLMGEHPDDAKDDDNGRVLYVAGSWQAITAVQDWCHRLKLPERFRERVLRVRGRTIPKPHMLNFTSASELRRMGERLAPDAVEILVVDERNSLDFNRALPFVKRLEPLFTLVLTTQVRADYWGFVAPLRQLHGSQPHAQD